MYILIAILGALLGTTLGVLTVWFTSIKPEDRRLGIDRSFWTALKGK